jgi:SH3-like domain-containing protein
MFARGVAQKWLRVGFLLALGLSDLLSAQLNTQPLHARPSWQGVGNPNVYMPLIPSNNSVVGSVAVLVPGEPVYGLLGKVERPVRRLHTYYLATADAGFYALAGQTPIIEAKISALADADGVLLVKVWGVVHAAEQAGEPLLIVVSGILGAEAVLPAATAAPAPTLAPVPMASVKFDAVNLYSGPSSANVRVGVVIRRQVCNITGRNLASSWLLLTCADGQQGWIDARLVDVRGNVAIVLVVNVTMATPTPRAPAATATPTAVPQLFAGWRMELYRNQTLSGSPVAVVDVPTIDFSWASGGPSQTSTDGFSVRFSRQISVPPAFYEFRAEADDGIRVWVDDKLIINAWPANPNQQYRVGQVLAGNHEIRVEYYEQSGLAKVRLNYAPLLDNSVWQASYFYGVSPTGNPAFQQQEPLGQNPLDYNWLTGSPQSGLLGNDYWSVRWRGEFDFEEGNYLFRANADDGLRLYLDGLLVLDYWRDGYKDVTNRVLGIGAGSHTVEVHYYERSGDAMMKLWWYRDSAYVGPQ